MGAVVIAGRRQSITTISGKSYNITYDVSSLSLTNATAAVTIGTTAGGIDVLNESITSNGSKSHTFIAASSTSYIDFTLRASSASPDTMYIDNVSVLIDNTGIDTIGVSFRDGYKPRFYIDGEFYAEGDIAVSTDDTDTTDLVVGNENELTDVTPLDIKQVFVANRPLTDIEHRALYQQCRVINSTQVI